MVSIEMQFRVTHAVAFKRPSRVLKCSLPISFWFPTKMVNSCFLSIPLIAGQRCYIHLYKMKFFLYKTLYTGQYFFQIFPKSKFSTNDNSCSWGEMWKVGTFRKLKGSWGNIIICKVCKCSCNSSRLHSILNRIKGWTWQWAGEEHYLICLIIARYEIFKAFPHNYQGGFNFTTANNNCPAWVFFLTKGT